MTIPDGVDKASDTTEPPELLKDDAPLIGGNRPIDPTDRIGHILADRPPLVSVPLSAELSVATTKMMALDYSQLGVTNGPNNVRGVVSWRSIARKLLLGDGTTKVRECIEHPQLVLEDESLLKTIPVIAEHDYVLVRTKNGLVTGIVTAADLSCKFQELAEPFLLLREIERHLRKIAVDSGLSPAEMQNAVENGGGRKRIEGTDDLTLGECIRLFQRPETWSKLRLRNIDRGEFIDPLVKINELRNRVMHFRADELVDDETKLLRNFAGMVRIIDEARSMGR